MENVNKLNTMNLDNTIKRITEIVMKACSHLQKNFDLDIPDDPKKLWERSYNDIEKNGRIFALYSCGMVSIYLYHCLKEDFPNLSIGLLTGEKANEKKKNAPKEEKLHFFVKVKDQGKNYIIDNRTKMVIDIFQ